MDNNVQKIRDRIRNEMPNIVAVNEKLRHFPIVSFDGSAKVSIPCSKLIGDVAGHLNSRGIRTCVIKRYTSSVENEHELNQAEQWLEQGVNSCLLMTPHATIKIDRAPKDESLVQAIESLGNQYDVILGDSLGFVSVPHILVTDRPREAFNMGLPGVFAYISEADVKAQIPRISYKDMDIVADLIVNKFGLGKNANPLDAENINHKTPDNAETIIA